MIKKAFFLLLLFISCTSDEITELPSLAEEGVVNFTVTDPIVINTPNSYYIAQGQGSKGVVVFNTGNTTITYRAFDLGCPYISPSDCISSMTVDTAGTMYCDDCADDDISFSHFNTSVTIEGNTYYLVEYNAVFNGSSIRVTNFNR